MPIASPRKRSDVSKDVNQKEIEIRKAYAILPFANPSPGTSIANENNYQEEEISRIQTMKRKCPYPKVSYPSNNNYKDQGIN